MGHAINQQVRAAVAALSSLFLIVGIFYFHSLSAMEDASLPTKAEITARLFKLPLSFEKNEGQTHPSVRYLTRGPGYAFYFASDEMSMVLQKASSSSVLKMHFSGANTNPNIIGINEQPGKSHYFIGSDPQKWQTQIPHFAKVCYQEIYPGIDVVFYGNPQQLEYDLCVAPGSNPHDIRLHIDGTQELSLYENGCLQLLTEDGQQIHMPKPTIYQIVDGNRVFIEGQFVLLAENDIGFSLQDYDPSKGLIIDPVLVYSTYLGGSNQGGGDHIVVDSNGNTYITGSTSSSNFPTTTGAFQTSLAGMQNASVTKLNADGSALVYSTYLGGSVSDTGRGIKIDSSGNAYVTGFTRSPDFPVTPGAFQPTFQGQEDAFVTKLNSSGSALVYSTYLGGNNLSAGLGIAIDNSNNAYITGLTQSTNFPITAGALQPSLGGLQNAFLTKLNSAGSALIYSTYLGGNTMDTGIRIAVDGSGNAYIIGNTTSPNFPTTPGAFQTTFLGVECAFVAKINPTLSGLSSLVYSTFLSGSTGFTFGTDITIDSSENVYVTGKTAATDFPTTPGAFQTTSPSPLGGGYVTKLNSTGSALIYSTYLGGDNGDEGDGIAIDSNENAYIIGTTKSTNFPITMGAIQTTLSGTVDTFVTKLNAAGSALIYSTYLGGDGVDLGASIAVDNNGNAYVTGNTTSTNFPTTPGAFQTTLTGFSAAFVSKLAIGTPTVTEISPNFGPTTGGTSVTITGTNFTNVTAVNFDSVPATSFTVNSDTSITAISPPHSVGTVDVTVTTFGGTSPTSPADQFTYKNITTTVLTVSPNPAPFHQPVTLTATVTPSSATGSVTFFDGTSAIGTAPLKDGTATFVTSRLAVGTHILTAVYSGDNSNLSSTSQPVKLKVITALPPTHLKGIQKINRFATQTDIINILTWQEPQHGTLIVSYQIYRDRHLKKHIATLSSHEELQFKDHNREKDKTYTYFIVSINQFGNRSKAAKVIVHPHK